MTLVGARDQIYERLSEDPKLQQYEESDLRKMALWLAKETMDQVDRQFPGAARVMAWLRQVATARPNTILSLNAMDDANALAWSLVWIAQGCSLLVRRSFCSVVPLVRRCCGGCAC